MMTVTPLMTPLTVSSLPTCAVIEEIETFIFTKKKLFNCGENDIKSYLYAHHWDLSTQF